HPRAAQRTLERTGERSIVPSASDADEVTSIRVEKRENERAPRLICGVSSDHLQRDHSRDGLPSETCGMNEAAHLLGREIWRLFVVERDENNRAFQFAIAEQPRDFK